VDTRNEIREFLTSRRAKVTPEQSGLPMYGGSRRVPGLRREEVALLAGVSVDYYTRLERGNLAGVSDNVLDALARALQLDEAERTHLFDLARTANTSAAATRTRRRPARHVRTEVQHLLDAMTMAPAYVRDPYDRALTDLVGELSTRSDLFRTWWAAHNVRLHRTGTKHVHHPVVGELVLTDSKQTLVAVQEVKGPGRGKAPPDAGRAAGPSVTI
jgi:transcriptional regulator with XRE-family HTH domain